ncbi:MAG: hypothetical protein Q8Q78_05005 [Hydrogenophaga sp.]|nr:hypothetical protein [Hydrogenophaga sp.]
METGDGPGARIAMLAKNSDQPRAHCVERAWVECQAFVRGCMQVNVQLASYEQLQFLAVAREPWSIENGCLTPTMKIKRSRIEASMAPHLPQWYEQPQTVIWA